MSSFIVAFFLSLWCLFTHSLTHSPLSARSCLPDLAPSPTLLTEFGSVIHACRLEDNVFVGAGSTVLDGSVIGTGAIVTAGSLVSPNTQIPAGQVTFVLPLPPLSFFFGPHVCWLSVCLCVWC